MNAIDKTILDSDVSLGRLLDAIGGARDLPMILSHDGRPMKGAYRLAGVKVGPSRHSTAVPGTRSGPKFSCSCGTLTRTTECTYRPASSPQSSARYRSIFGRSIGATEFQRQ